jgi:hypothetical protein
MRSYLEIFNDILLKDDFITSDKFLKLAKVQSFQYYKRDILYTGGEWRSDRKKSILEDIPNNIGNTILIGHSDKRVNSFDLFLFQAMGIRYVYGTNTLNKKGFSTSVPLGLTNDTNESKLHKIFGNTSHFSDAHESANLLPNFNRNIYVNFTSKTNLKKRENLLKIVNQMKNIEFGQMDFTNRGRIRYLQNLRTNSFVLCPEGNGIDTHRLWETIYMGGIPIILRNKHLPSVLSELPVLQIDNWTEILDTNFLELSWNNLKELDFDYSKIQMSYWIDFISKPLK